MLAVILSAKLKMYPSYVAKLEMTARDCVILSGMSMLSCPGLTELIREYSLCCISRVDLSWSNY